MGDSRGVVGTLRSCVLVGRPSAPVARRHPLKVAFSRVWSLAARQLESVRKYSIPPTAHPSHHTGHSMLPSPLSMAPLDTAFSSVTSIELGSWDAVIACDVDGLCRTIVSLGLLRDLRLVHLAWGGEGSNSSQMLVTSHSSARPHEIVICARHNWLLDVRSAHFITWLARSGAASQLKSIHFERMMILDKRLLAAVATVINTSKGSLQHLFLSVGPDLTISSRKY